MAVRDDSKHNKSPLRKIVLASIGALSTGLADRQLDSLMRTPLPDVRTASPSTNVADTISISSSHGIPGTCQCRRRCRTPALDWPRWLRRP